ncbi:PREDICTED: U-box domain-containing protein 33-like isoform X2 [Erythranthe guttata]|uniref:U-box domain-containing protein 33-like isoform X2 n=1 Tax=Erythranthe guttata TaxID=4155 RepID=UPI00064E0D6F|nr:PREDICTED: U-box domain-containing protein 33-like isoform X2 [Erythranthe guttata]|eukprot:XP_012827818.1 PREDICTED: U-box domain-containing protein 33-like isoform X2 [Erythranthe guttata]
MAALLTHTHRPAEDLPFGFSPPPDFRHDSGRAMTRAETGGGKVHVAVGKSVEKTVALLTWTFSMFPGQEICLLHVHRPCHLIPTLCKLPASGANPKMVAAFRNEEREDTMKLLSTYFITCTKSKVKASVITIEADDVQRGILNLVNRHGVRKLVVGAIPDFMKGKKSSCKACLVAKIAPSYCEMWFVNNGKLIWTRQASDVLNVHPLSCQLAAGSSNSCRNQVQAEAFPTDVNLATTFSECVEATFELLNNQIAKTAEVKGKVDEWKNEAFNKVKALETAHARELKLRIEAENALWNTINEQEKIIKEREGITDKLQKTRESNSLLERRTQEANRRCEEVSRELKLIQSSIAELRKEKQKLKGEKMEATRLLDCGPVGDIYEFREFSLSDIEGATCNFSESFKIGKGGCGIVYKGEMFDKTVAIKKLHSYDVQRQMEFHKVVQVLGKLRHPNLVELIGVCQESLLLIYDYMPCGSLHNHLSSRNDVNALSWKTRTRIVANIASGLLFLHSFGPKKIVHGNLKPENILLDSQNRCRISDYVDHMLIDTSQTLRCPSFRHLSGGACLYADPESSRTGEVNQKSDIYSFGVIILQLVTGRSDGGLVGYVRRVFSSSDVADILDSSAGDWSVYVGRRLVELGLQCCESNGRDRPEITPSLVKELQCMPFLEEQTVPSFFLCPILREIMHDPQVAADGFTYEGEAMRGWLGNGHVNSPMTNLTLSHFDLTPNHSLRLAIKDWLANLEIDSFDFSM